MKKSDFSCFFVVTSLFISSDSSLESASSVGSEADFLSGIPVCLEESSVLEESDTSSPIGRVCPEGFESPEEPDKQEDEGNDSEQEQEDS